MPDYIQLFKKMQPGSKDWWATEPVKGSKILIGKNKNEFPAILVNVGESISLIDKPLKHISLIHNLKFIDENKTESIYSVIELNSEDGNDDLIEIFLRCSEAIIGQLPKNIEIEDFKECFAAFVKIFEKLSRPSLKTTMGLWTELLFVSLSADPDFFIESWHSNVGQIYDFSYANEKIEVKSSSSDKRKHNFSLSQLNPPEDLKLVIVSFIVNESEKYGKSINDLLDELSLTIKAGNRMKLYQMIGDTLGKNAKEGMKIKFDYESAKDSVGYYDWKVIPRIDKRTVEKGVDVPRFSSTVGDITQLSVDEVKTYGHIFSKI